MCSCADSAADNGNSTSPVGSTSTAVVTSVTLPSSGGEIISEVILGEKTFRSDKEYIVRLAAYCSTEPEGVDSSFFGSCEYRLYDAESGSLLDLITIANPSSSELGLKLYPRYGSDYIVEYPMIPDIMSMRPYSVIGFTYPCDDVYVTELFMAENDEIIQLPIEYRGKTYYDLFLRDNFWQSFSESYTYNGNSDQIMYCYNNDPPENVAYTFEMDNHIISAEDVFTGSDEDDDSCPPTIMYENVHYTCFKYLNVNTVEESEKVDLSEWRKAGTVESVIDAAEMPQEDYQANFADAKDTEIYVNSDHIMLIQTGDDYMPLRSGSNEKDYTGTKTPPAATEPPQTSAQQTTAPQSE